MSKKQRRNSKDSAEKDSTEGLAEATDVGSERGNWASADADNFHWYLSKFTRFEDNVLQLDHRYLDIRDIRIVENIEIANKGRKVPDKELIHELDISNEANPNKDCRRWFTLLRELQAAAGNMHTIRQINTKHINTRSRWSVPFKSLNEVGYLIKNQTLRGIKRRANSVQQEGQTLQRTNIEKKNLAAIKALRKYIKYKGLFWNYETNSMPNAELYALLCSTHPEMEDVSEPERWIRAMIRRHGYQMVEYMDKCAVNLTNSYIRELNQRKNDKAPIAEVTTDNYAEMANILGLMTEEVMQRNRSTSGKRASKAGAKAVPPLDISGAAAGSVTGTKRIVSFSAGPDDSGLESSTSPTTAATSNELNYQNFNADSSQSSYYALSGQNDKLPTVKRSKSHVFGKSKTASAQGHSLPSSVSYTNMPAYSSVAPVANSTMAGSGSQTDSINMPAQYDEGLFTQFINYETLNTSHASSGDLRAGREYAGKDSEQLAPGELVDAIINLSVNNGTSSVGQRGYDYMNAVHDQFPPYSSSHPVSARIPGDTGLKAMHMGGKAHSHVNIPAYPHDSNSYGSQTPASLTRTTSDEKNMHGSYPNAYNVPSQQQHEAQIELQSIFGSKDSAFSFQVPSYNWPSETTENSGLPSQGMLSESFSMPSLASYARSTSMAAYGTPAQPPLYMSSVSPSQDATHKPHIVAQPLGQSTQGKSQLSTTLIIINGVPSHIELTHDNAESNPDNSSQEAAAVTSISQQDDMAQNSVSLVVVWTSNKRYNVRVAKYATVRSIKVLLEGLTEVDANSQKLLGLVRGHLPRDTDTLDALGVISGTRVRLMGTRKSDQLRSIDTWSECTTDAVVSSSNDSVATDEELMERNRTQLVAIRSTAEMQIINAPRVGRKLVVLDLDYTLLDCNLRSGDVVGMARPGLHEFLSAIYPHYDIIVWSQTRWPALECKITVLGMLTHPRYRITLALDSTTMFSVRVLRNGREHSHHVKALEIIWARFPHVYTRENTVHVDDLERNFAMNKQNGLRIRQYKRSSSRARRDTELAKLAQYLLLIAELPSFEHLNHAQWQSYR
ncbi:hypothetical protein IW148_001489 [Coemansia sp. RSA 1199]|nr:hypothetical protein IW148_001489 [Coemansia sp. RSA 1199]